MWTLWNCRNDEVKDEVRRSALMTVIYEENYPIEFQEAQQRLERQVSEEGNRWEPPKNDAVKINFDGAFNEAEGVGGIGVIIRDVIISKPYIRS